MLIARNLLAKSQFLAPAARRAPARTFVFAWLDQKARETEARISNIKDSIPEPEKKISKRMNSRLKTLTYTTYHIFDRIYNRRASEHRLRIKAGVISVLAIAIGHFWWVESFRLLWSVSVPTALFLFQLLREKYSTDKNVYSIHLAPDNLSIGNPHPLKIRSDQLWSMASGRPRRNDRRYKKM
jgi:hypothetical protein